MSCYCDFNGPNVFEEIRHVARKQHKCYECGEPINKGDTYYRISGMWESSWNHFKHCDCCHEEVMVLREKNVCYEYGNINEQYAELWRWQKL